MQNCFNISDQVIIITGGTGGLGASMAKHLLAAGAKVVILGVRPENLEKKVAELSEHGELLGFVCNVLSKEQLIEVKQKVLAHFGRIDVLINAAGGNTSGAVVADTMSVFDIAPELHQEALSLNLDGTLLPTLVFGESIAQSGKGQIINISSVTTYNAVSRVMGYSVAKTAINNFTQWMAMEMACKFGDKVRVNAIAPGFFVTTQNKNLLLNEDGSYTERSKKVLAKTPMGRFGRIDELNGLVHFLCSDAASYITGALIPVDGGYSAFSGV